MTSTRMLLTLTAAIALFVVPAVGQDTKGGQEQPTADDQKREAIQRGLEAQLRGTEVRVTLTLRNAKVEDAIAEFRRQVVGMDFILDNTNIPDDYRIDELIIKDKPWRDVFEVFLLKVGLMIDDERPGIVKLSKPARVTFALKDADIKSVVDLIARISRANIVLAPNVEGKITLSVNDVPWNVVLETVVKTLGNFTVVKEKFDILRIIHAEELKKQMETRMIKLNYITPPATYTAKIDSNKQISGSSMPPPTSRDDIVKQFTLLNMLRAILTRQGDGGQTLGRIEYDIESNSMVVTDTKIVLDRVEEIVKVLDVEPEQVLIDVKFVSTQNDDLLQFGVNYSIGSDEGLTFSTRPLQPLPQYTGIPGYPGGSGTATLPTGQVSRLPFGLGNQISQTDTFFLTTYEMVATFRAFRRDRFTKLLQEPQISVLNNHEATIFVGETIAFAEAQGVSSQQGGLQFTISEAAKSPVKIGFQLFIVPRVLRKENKIVLTVIPQNEFLNGTSASSQVAGFEHFEIQGLGLGGGNLSIDLPRVATSTLVTRLMVESGRTAVLGGLVTERISYEDKKIPILGDIPIINPLFKQRSDRVTREHLLIFVTPRIVRSARESEQVLRAQLKELEELERKRLDEMRRKKSDEDARRAKEKADAEAAEAERIRREQAPKK